MHIQRQPINQLFQGAKLQKNCRYPGYTRLIIFA